MLSSLIRNLVFLLLLSGLSSVIVTDVKLLYVVLIKNQQKLPGYYIVANLSLCDAVTLMVLNIVIIYFHLNKDVPIGKSELFKVILTFGQITQLTSLLTALLLSIDRFLAIKFCLSYHAIVTVKIIVMVISFCWIFSIATIPLLWINGASGDIYTDRSIVSHCDAWINFNFSFNLYKSCKKKTLNQSSREKTLLVYRKKNSIC